MTITDKTGMPIKNVDSARLDGSVGSKAVKVVSISPLATLPRVLLMFDKSGSMRKRAGDSVRGMKQILKSLQPRHSVAMVAFSDKVETAVGFEAPLVEVENAIVQMFSENGSWQGITTLYDSIAAALKVFGKPQLGDSIVLFSDGGENGSNLRIEKLEKLLIDRGVRIFVYVIEGEPDTPAEIKGAFAMNHLSEVTGGIAVPSNDLSKNPAEISEQIDHTYAIEVRLEEELSKEKKWKLQAHPMAATDKKIVVHYPERLFPCSPDKMLSNGGLHELKIH